MSYTPYHPQTRRSLLPETSTFRRCAACVVSPSHFYVKKVQDFRFTDHRDLLVLLWYTPIRNCDRNRLITIKGDSRFVIPETAVIA